MFEFSHTSSEELSCKTWANWKLPIVLFGCFRGGICVHACMGEVVLFEVLFLFFLELVGFVECRTSDVAL